MASFKFIQKLWTLHNKILKKIELNENSEEEDTLTKFTNQLSYKITKNLEKFHYNVIIANFYEMYNFLIKELDKKFKKKIIIENYKTILVLMLPFIPHFANECLKDIVTEKAKWPEISKEQLIEDNINFVVQINGKKRALLNVKRDIDEKTLLNEIQYKSLETEKFLKGKKIKKTIFVSNRLINIILV